MFATHAIIVNTVLRKGLFFKTRIVSKYEDNINNKYPDSIKGMTRYPFAKSSVVISDKSISLVKIRPVIDGKMIQHMSFID
jgi:hypothetical protein